MRESNLTSFKRLISSDIYRDKIEKRYVSQTKVLSSNWFKCKSFVNQGVYLQPLIDSSLFCKSTPAVPDILLFIGVVILRKHNIILSRIL